MSDLPESLRRSRKTADGPPRLVAGPANAIAATAPRPVPYGTPLDFRPQPAMRRIQQGDFAQSRGMGQDEARSAWAYGGDRLRGAGALLADMTGIPAALSAADAFAHGDVLSGALGAGEAALNFLPEAAAAARPALRAGRGLFGRAAAETAPALRASDPVPLPMDEASRMARAREQGFEGPFYHGTDQDIGAFNAHDGWYGNGVYVTSSPEAAGRYAQRTPNQLRGGDGEPAPNVMPVFVRGRRAPMAEFEELNSPDRLGDRLKMTTPAVQQELQRRGYSGVQIGGPDKEAVVYDPRDLRSAFATFDPAKSGSSDLLAGLPIALGGAALAAQEAQKPRGGLFGRSFRMRDAR